MNLGIIGYGTMGRAIAQQLLKKKLVKPRSLFTSNHEQSNRRVLSRASIIVLSVKPQFARDVLLSLKPFVEEHHCFLSIMAGVSIKMIQRLLGTKQVIRAMPNTPAKIGKGVTVWMAARQVPRRERAIARRMFRALGVEFEVRRESDIDRATALFGSGPAYVFYFIEAMEEAGKKLGFPTQHLRPLVAEMLSGSLALLASSELSPDTLRKQVTSKKGTTAAALRVLEQKKLKAIVASAVQAAYKRAEELSWE